MVIDKVQKNKLTKDYLLKFSDLHQMNKEQMINININNEEIGSMEITAFKAGILPEDFKEEIKDDDIITLTISDYQLVFYGFDYLWWVNHKIRLNKLFSTSSTSVIKEKKDEEKYSVACANLTENGVEEIKVCEGNKKELIEFIDSEIKRRDLQSFREALVVFKFYYTEKDATDPLVWSTIDELAEQGVVVLK